MDKEFDVKVFKNSKNYQLIIVPERKKMDKELIELLTSKPTVKLRLKLVEVIE